MARKFQEIYLYSMYIDLGKRTGLVPNSGETLTNVKSHIFESMDGFFLIFYSVTYHNSY